jgi:hypothetical protein
VSGPVGDKHGDARIRQPAPHFLVLVDRPDHRLDAAAMALREHAGPRQLTVHRGPLSAAGTQPAHREKLAQPDLRPLCPGCRPQVAAQRQRHRHIREACLDRCHRLVLERGHDEVTRTEDAQRHLDYLVLAAEVLVVQVPDGLPGDQPHHVGDPRYLVASELA